MPFFTKESLDTLKSRIDLVEVIKSHVELNRSGAAYKGLCPFHDEKTPSFMIGQGDRHYHCFGCGAHGDAIGFLMTYLKLSFNDAVKSLAEQFHVHLDYVEGDDEYKGPDKKVLREALDTACRFFQFYLLHTKEGHEALKYLYSRGLDLEFVKQFQLGLAPLAPGVFRKVMVEKGLTDDVMAACGLLSKNETGRTRDFFIDRIMFPIHQAAGAVIGFSARKYKDTTFGGKYVNTPETSLFKKSRVLFGLNFSRRRIAKERRVIVVEGQIDALKLIQAGFNFTVAGQGTAFGQGHVDELLTLGINQVFLALDPDEAGMKAMVKIGDMFQKEGIQVYVVAMPEGYDPDTYIKEHGPDGFETLLKTSDEYLSFLVRFLSCSIDVKNPAGKNELVGLVSKQIRGWQHKTMMHESLRKLAHLMQIPEELVGVGQEFLPNTFIKKSGNIELVSINPERILESDFLRWLIILGEKEKELVEIAKQNLTPGMLKDEACVKFYQTYLDHVENGLPKDVLSLIKDIETQKLVTEIMNKKVNRENAGEQLIHTIQKILDRNWMEQREEIRMKIQSATLSDDEAIAQAKEFDVLKKNPPRVRGLESIKTT